MDEKKTLTPKTLTRSPPWLDLPQPLTEHILERLPLPDYIRFAAVCSRWRSVQSDHRLRHLPRPPPFLPLPLLTISELDSPTRDSRDSNPQSEPRPCLPCFSPFEQKFYRLHPIPAPRSNCIASQSSWLLIHEIINLSRSLAFFSLFNPLSGSHIQLPSLPITIYNDDDHPHIPVTGAISSPPSNPNCAVMIIHHNDFYLFRLAGPAWTKLRIPSPATSVITIQGKFYCNCLGVLVRVNFESPKPILEMFELDATQIPGGAIFNHLVEWNGEVLVVPILSEGDEPQRKIKGAQVFKADLVNNVWVRLESLGDHVVIVGHNSSVSLLGDDVGVGRGDYVYLTNPLVGIHWCNPGRWSPWVVLDLKTGRMTSAPFPKKIPKSDKIVFRKRLLHWILPREA